MADDFDFDDAPPPAPEARIAKIPIGESRWIVLGTGRGLWLHWEGKRTTPCDGDNCPAGRHRRPAHWTCYLPAALQQIALDETDGKHKASYEKVVLSVNQEQAEKLRDQPFPIRLTIRRIDGKKGFSILKIEPLQRHPNIPAAFPVETTLYRVFGRRPSTNGTSTNGTVTED